MNQRRSSSVALLLLLLVLFQTFPLAQTRDSARRELAPDQAEDEDDLNRELWEYAKNTPFASIQDYIERAQAQARAAQSTEAILPDGWRLAPAGTQVEVGRLPYEAIPFAGQLVVLNTGYYSREPQEVSVVDSASGRLTKTIRLNSLFPSATTGLDGDLYISGGFDQKVFRVNREFNVAREYPVGGYAAGIVAIDVNHVAVVYIATKDPQGDYTRGKVALLNTQTGKVERESEAGHYPYAIRYTGGKLYVTQLGEDRLLVYDTQLKQLKTINVGRTPQEMCVDGNRLYVANSNSDDLSVVDTKLDRLITTVNLKQRGSAFGAAPTSCTVNGGRLYVTLAGINAIAVIDKSNRRQLGLIPTGWYPTKVLFDKGQLLVLSAKGIRTRRPNPKGPQPVTDRSGPDYVLTLLKGSLGIVPGNQIQQSLKTWTRAVEAGSPTFSLTSGPKLPIRHIFYIIKENRTYDQILGDLGRGNGDPSLTLFGRDVTPNHHKLAEEFVTLDNFFVNGEISVLGHAFTTSGYASPFLEWVGNAAYSGRFKGYPFGSVPSVTSPAYLWDALDDAKVSYRIYGENYFLYTRAYKLLTDTYGSESELAKKFYDRTYQFLAKVDRGNQFYELAKGFYGQANTIEDANKLLDKPEFVGPFSKFLTGDDSLARALHENAALRRGFAHYLYHYSLNYRSWDLKYSDIDRFKAWRTDFDQQIASGTVPQFEYLWLPNDHTNGADTSILSPFGFVAQNDAALGKIVETISHSPIWRESLIMIEEDDAQNGPDHVDATRTVAFAVGPYVKRGAVISDRFDQLSMLRTIELLLNVKPLNLGDRLAVPMFSIFTDKPDFAPYTPTEPSKYLKN
jgi:YVTN family beta-propeller protein